MSAADCRAVELQHGGAERSDYCAGGVNAGDLFSSSVSERGRWKSPELPLAIRS